MDWKWKLLQERFKACKLAVADYTLFYLLGGKRFPQSIPRNGDIVGELSSLFFYFRGAINEKENNGRSKEDEV